MLFVMFDFYLIFFLIFDLLVMFVFMFLFVVSLLGMFEFGYDVFYVVVGNVSIVGSFVIWEVDMCLVFCLEEGVVCVSKVMDILEVLLFNGVVVLFKVDSMVFIVDFFFGVVWKFNVKIGVYDIVFFDFIIMLDFLYVGGLFGVNGLKICDGYLYFMNIV